MPNTKQTSDNKWLYSKNAQNTNQTPTDQNINALFIFKKIGI